MGYPVSGSDLSGGPITENLRAKGARIFQGHVAGHVNEAGLVVCSTAIQAANPEIQRARELGLPIWRRADMLAALMRLKRGIAVAGSHGKTTTTSLLATIFHEAGRDPTHIIGGVVANLGGNARKGEGEALIAEADESDGSFLLLDPQVAVVTNVDNDHLDHHGSVENIRRAFAEFVTRVPAAGTVVVNGQDEGCALAFRDVRRPLLRFGLGDPTLDYSAHDVSSSADSTTFTVRKHGVRLGEVETRLSGAHNVMNVLAALAVADAEGVPFTAIQLGLARFAGVGRRLERLWHSGDFEIIDDYGHHPTEIRATLAALRQHRRKHICVVFEPHRYTRTQQLWSDFVTSFADADEVYIGPIYAASEKPLEGITGEALAGAIPGAHYLSKLTDMEGLIRERLTRPMVFLTLGAGAVSRVARETVARL
jgi:UDP-N-acetylmuramate--alanine ligase